MFGGTNEVTLTGAFGPPDHPGLVPHLLLHLSTPGVPGYIQMALLLAIFCCVVASGRPSCFSAPSSSHRELASPSGYCRLLSNITLMMPASDVRHCGKMDWMLPSPFCYQVLYNILTLRLGPPLPWITGTFHDSQDRGFLFMLPSPPAVSKAPIISSQGLTKIQGCFPRDKLVIESPLRTVCV